MTASDRQQIQDVFQRTLANMTDAGVRTSPGQVNNLSSTINLATFGLLGNDYSGCKDQAEFMAAVLGGLKLQDQWTFAVTSRSAGFHTNIQATSSNPNDAPMVIDPWKGTIDGAPVPSPAPPATPPTPSPAPNLPPLPGDSPPPPPTGESGGSNVPRDADTRPHFNGLSHGYRGPNAPVACRACGKNHGAHNLSDQQTCWCGQYNDYDDSYLKR